MSAERIREIFDDCRGEGVAVHTAAATAHFDPARLFAHASEIGALLDEMLDKPGLDPWSVDRLILLGLALNERPV